MQSSGSKLFSPETNENTKPFPLSDPSLKIWAPGRSVPVIGYQSTMEGRGSIVVLFDDSRLTYSTPHWNTSHSCKPWPNGSLYSKPVNFMDASYSCLSVYKSVHNLCVSFLTCVKVWRTRGLYCASYVISTVSWCLKKNVSTAFSRFNLSQWVLDVQVYESNSVWRARESYQSHEKC